MAGDRTVILRDKDSFCCLPGAAARCNVKKMAEQDILRQKEMLQAILDTIPP
jgi:hypothetical protein